MKKIAIMQPYFLPYIGYWQLINAVDVFVVYDNIKYTKKGWFNRNRFLQDGKDRLFTIALKNDPDYLDVKNRYISPDFSRGKLINQFKTAYSRSPHFKEVFPVLEATIQYEDNNLFEYIYNAIKNICSYLDINTTIVISSTINIDHSLKAEKRVLAICKALDATTYINAIGGVELYNKDKFKTSGIELKFLKSNNIEYAQFNDMFVPWLSIVDVMMFNEKKKIELMLKDYDLV